MRLFLLPISTRRTLIYCQKLNVTTSDKTTLADKVTTKAANLWAGWEKKESGWQKKVVDYGNKALKRIPYEEWGLKSIPPLSTRRKKDEMSGTGKIEVLFPSMVLPGAKVSDILKDMATERQGFHKSRLMYCFVGMPITAPFALIPIIPNLPFFYLVYRAWSHWRALSGSKHIMFLQDNGLLSPKVSPILDTIYSAGIIRAVRDGTVLRSKPLGVQDEDPKGDIPKEAMVLSRWNGKLIAKALEIPELEVEIDRAIWQVENSLKSDEEPKKENETEKGTPESTTARKDDKL